jgi:hypothetical protein
VVASLRVFLHFRDSVQNMSLFRLKSRGVDRSRLVKIDFTKYKVYRLPVLQSCDKESILFVASQWFEHQLFEQLR